MTVTYIPMPRSDARCSSSSKAATQSSRMTTEKSRIIASRAVPSTPPWVTIPVRTTVSISSERRSTSSGVPWNAEKRGLSRSESTGPSPGISSRPRAPGRKPVVGGKARALQIGPKPTGARDAADVVDARGRLVLPGAVDSHFHIGIYRDLAADATSETASALAGGVTTVLSYFRTGQHYLNKSGPYRTIFPEVVAATAGHAYTDFGYHLGIMTSEQLDEVDWLVGEQGVGSFKYYMFYKGLNLTSDSTRGSAYTMSDAYDLGHLYLLMRRVASASAGNGARGRVSLSLHCEQAELIRVFIEEVRRSGPGGLEGYHRARPPLTERLSIAEAMVLADATRCPVNLLHLSSVEALAAAAQGRREFPHLDIRLETTLHHLALTHATAHGILGKVNPPIRTEADREALWDAVVRGSIDTVVSDHACCAEADKGEDRSEHTSELQSRPHLVCR